MQATAAVAARWRYIFPPASKSHVPERPSHEGPVNFPDLSSLQSTTPSSFWVPHAMVGVSSACGGACAVAGAAAADFAPAAETVFAALTWVAGVTVVAACPF